MTSAKYIDHVYKTRDEIIEQAERMASEINSFYHGETVLLVSVLKGGVMFGSELQQRISLDCEVEYVCTKSYGANGKFQKPEISQVGSFTVADKNVIVVDDMIDTGDTMGELLALYRSQGAKSVAAAAMIKKPTSKLSSEFKCFVGFGEDPGGYLLGFGLDFTKQEMYRNLPCICVVKSEFMTKQPE